jgi:hypothetical protein
METNVISNLPEPSDVADSSTNGSSLWKYLIIFLILAVLGFNLFTYVGHFSDFLGKIVDRILDVFKPILAYFGYGISETVKKTVDLTATGSKKAIDVTADTLTGGISALQSGLSKENKDKHKQKNKQKELAMPLPDEAGSLTQASKASRKAGFCYIGEDRGFRSCISVGEGDTCMSGDIFPSHDICINPNLRSG